MSNASGRDAALQRRKSRIIDAAIACFLENGYHQTGVRDIARKAGISLGNLYNHFAGKEAVLAEIAALDREETKPYLRLLEEDGHPADILMRFVSVYAADAQKSDYVILTIEIISEAVHKPEIADLFVENWSALVRALGELLRRGSAVGCFRDFTDPDAVADIILDAIESYGLRRHLSGGHDPSALDELRDFIHHATRR